MEESFIQIGTRPNTIHLIKASLVEEIKEFITGEGYEVKYKVKGTWYLFSVNKTAEQSLLSLNILLSLLGHLPCT